MRFFISSTFKDLEEYREYTIKYLNNLTDKKTGKVIAMEYFPASEKDSYDICLNELEKSDFVIGIYGQRFGWEPDETGRSMTEIEFDLATKLGIPVLKLVSRSKKEEKQERFINEKILIPGANCGRFKSLEDFAFVLHESIKVHFENVEGFSYYSIWDDIKLMRQIIEEDINKGSLRMHIYEDGEESTAIDQIFTSVQYLENLKATIHEMYYACTNLHEENQTTNKLGIQLNQMWESFILGLPNHLSAIRLAVTFLRVSHLQHRLLTEPWTEDLRQEVIAARNKYINVSGDSYHID